MKTKIRLWSEEEKKYIYPDNPDFKHPDFPSLYALGLHGLPIAIDPASFNSGDSTITGWNVDHCFEPEFFTGLHDADGREIWEGDILVGEFYDPCVVYWCKKRAAFATVDPNCEPDFGDTLLTIDLQMFKRSLRVIGNIHENTPDVPNSAVEPTEEK